MALYSLRLRRTFASLSAIRRYVASTHAVCAPTNPSSSIFRTTVSSQWQSSIVLAQCCLFRSSMPRSFSSARSSYGNNNEDDKIGPDTILFEGCDYNHWLITMDFPKDPKPTPEEMVRTYEETCAKGLNISLEEAKKKMYACSTTTYQGFQAVMTEEESEKFKGLPGVVFVLPDSYIDPQNKEYGGDKYINGTIVPRPPPVQYGRQGGRYRDRNRNPDQPRYDRQGGSTSNWQGNPSYSQQGHMQGDGRNFGASQNSSPQQNYGPPGQQGERIDRYPNNRDYAPGGGRDTYQGGRGTPMPSYQGNNQGAPGTFSNQGGQGNYYPQGDRRNYAPPGQQGDFRGPSPPQGGHYGQGMGGYQGPGTGGAHGQGANPGGYGQGPSSGYQPGYPGHGEGQRYAQGDQRNMQGEQRSYAPVGETGTDQGRY